jgi:hypothetical protein
LLTPSTAQEGVAEPEVSGGREKRLFRSFCGELRSVGCDPGHVRLAELGHACGCDLVDVGQERERLISLCGWTLSRRRLRLWNQRPQKRPASWKLEAWTSPPGEIHLGP